MKKVGKTTRPFRYDLNQIPYDYTVEVMNRFKELDLVDRVPEELWTEVCNIVWEAATKTIPKKKKCKKEKCLSEEALQIAEERREAKSRGEREDIPNRIQSPNEQFKEVEENKRMGKTSDLFKKIGDTKGTFQARMGKIKDRNSKDLTEAEDTKKSW